MGRDLRDVPIGVAFSCTVVLGFGFGVGFCAAITLSGIGARLLAWALA